MENKTKILIIGIIDFILLLGSILAVSDWLDIVGRLKNPCGKCYEQNYNFRLCFEEKRKIKPFLINISNLNLSPSFEPLDK